MPDTGIELLDLNHADCAEKLEWFPRLSDAGSAQRSNWRLIGKGVGVYWPDIDEDLSTDGLLRGISATH